jgi:hypothetical protein
MARLTLFRRFALVPLLALGVVGLALPGCAADDGGTGEEAAVDEEPLTSVNPADVTAAQSTSLNGFSYDSLTPTTTKIMKASRYWMGKQDRETRYPKPRMCASNVSKVLFLSGITKIDQEGVRNMIADVRNVGGRVMKMPQDAPSFAQKINSLANGAIPAGTIIAGMSTRSSNPGDQHVGFIGHQDPDGTIWIYHNNWYRPANEGGQRKPHMVSDANLNRGFERQWMATPWIRVTRDASGKVTRAVSLLPALDDMDPFNANFQVTLAMLPEAVQELENGQGGGSNPPPPQQFTGRTCEVSSSDGKGNVRADRSSQSALKHTLDNGMTIYAKGKEGDWYTVDYAFGDCTDTRNCFHGFMHQSVLTKAPCGSNPSP